MVILTAEEVEAYKEFRASRIEERRSYVSKNRLKRLTDAEARLADKGFDSLPYYFAVEYHLKNRGIVDLKNELGLLYDDTLVLMSAFEIPKKTHSEIIRKRHGKHSADSARDEKGTQETKFYLTQGDESRIRRAYKKCSSIKGVGNRIAEVSRLTGFDSAVVSDYLERVE